MLWALVYSAEKQVQHEYLLASLVMKAVHALRTHSTRTEEVMGRAFTLIAQGRPIELPAVPAQATAVLSSAASDAPPNGLSHAA